MEHPKIRGLSAWKPLARGGFTLVWEARQDLLTRLVAVKVYQRGLADDVYDMFAREAGVIGRLSDHPGVVTAYDAGLLSDASPYVIMELCPGGSLTQWLKREDLRSEDQIRLVGVRVADALAAVHARGIVHRDVKPANILIDGFGSPRLADFGLAAVTGAEPPATDALKLTPAYAPPEAFAMSAATESGDVYSLAATLYALLAGKPPRSPLTDTDPQKPPAAAVAPITPIPGVNWFLMDVLMAALSSDPAARPSAADVRDQLSGIPGSRSRKPKTGVAVAEGQAPAILRKRPALTSGAADETATDPVEAGMAAKASRVRAQARADSPRRRAPRRAGILAMVAASVTLAASGAAWLIAEPASSGAPPAAITRSAESGVQSSTPTSPPAADATPSQQKPTPDDGTAEPTVQAIRLKEVTDSAKPFETVRIRGTYQASRFLQVQHWSDGVWLTFPVPAKTDESGEFTAYVELGQPSRHRLRVFDPKSGVTSKPFLLVIKS